MNNIEFKTLSYKNILSVGAMPIKIDLSRCATTAILGDNGQGKSVFLEALAFVLYGKPYRDIVKKMLVNNKNNKDLLIELFFTTGTDNVKVVRGIKPDIFEIYVNDKLIPQNADAREYQQQFETKLLKMDYDTFKQLVMIGKTSYVPFMRLPAAKRRSFIESVLSLHVFSDMVELHKKDTDTIKKAVAQCNTDIKILESKRESLHTTIERISEELQKQQTEKKAAYQEKLDQLTIRYDALEKVLIGLKDSLAKIDIEQYNNVKMEAEDSVKILNANTATFKYSITQNDKFIGFLQQNSNCPTCKQQIDDNFKKSHIADLETQTENLNATISEYTNELVELGEKIGVADSKLQHAAKLASAIKEVNASTVDVQSSIIQIQTEIDKPLDTGNIDKEIEGLALIDDKLTKINEIYQNLVTTDDYNGMVAKLLKDTGIKSVIIDNFLPVINSTINDYLHKLGLFATFTLDSQFNEEIKIRGFEPMVYNQLSEGEKLRFDMAVMMAWREIAKLKSNMSCNLLIMDEVFDSSLDQDGVNAFSDLLRLMGDLNVFVITHTPEKLAENFRAFMRFERQDGFTVLANDSGF